MRVRLAVAALVNSVFIKCASKYGGRDPPNKHVHTFKPIANQPQFSLNQNQEVGQKPAPSATPKELFDAEDFVHNDNT